jgi:HD superfamily phosphohydrolase YqeK
MPAQKRQLRKNYIGIVSDKIEEQRAVESLAKSDRLLKDYLRGLMTAVLNGDDDAR